MPYTPTAEPVMRAAHQAPAKGKRLHNRIGVISGDIRFKSRVAWHHSEPHPRLSWCPLLFDVAVSVYTAALKEAVAHHALGKQKNADRQGD